MVIDAPEITKFNSSAPPPDFNNLPLPQRIQRINPWEIKERIPIKLKTTIPSKIPKPDGKTGFEEISGQARYIVEGNPCVGYGGMSDIYRAWDRRLGKYVAVKKLKKWTSDSPEYENLIELEAKTMIRINHPGIPEIYDFSIVKTPDGEENPVMIMQLVNAEPLNKRINDQIRATLTAEEVTSIITQTADTVTFMNKKELFHTDIKPTNILLSKPHIKLIDFGSSNWVFEERAPVTPEYSAPEAISKDIKDSRTDEYSLAATAYDMIFKITPEQIGRKKIERLVGSDEFQYKLNEKNKNRLIEILLKGLAYEPEDRYQSCDEFAQEFSKVILNPQS